MSIKGEQVMMFYGDEASGGVISVFTNGKSKGNRPRKTSVHSIK